ncbi:MAG: hypothetical protein AAF738_05285, partial [Bacteroidota bacterium]
WELVEAREYERVFYAQLQQQAQTPKELLVFTDDGTYTKTHRSSMIRVWKGNWQTSSNNRLRFQTTHQDNARLEQVEWEEQWKVVEVKERVLKIAQLTSFGEVRYLYTYYKM